MDERERAWSARVALHTALHMAATRTQIYLTQEQRRRLDERGCREHRNLAELVRDAVDLHLATTPDPDAALSSTFGGLPSLTVPPRDDWDRA